MRLHPAHLSAPVLWRAFTLVVGTALAGSAAAADAPAKLKVGVFDMQEIMLVVFPDARAEVEQARIKGKPRTNPLPAPDPLKQSKEAEVIRKDIVKLSDDLERESATLSEEERERREREISKLRKQLVEMRSDVLRARKREFRDREQRVLDLVRQYAQERGFAMLYEKNHLFQPDVQRTFVLPAGAEDVTADIVLWVKAKAPEPPSSGAKPGGRQDGRGGGRGGGGGGGGGGGRVN
jgi:Skp family chaperone for outer membrane proteins